MEHDEDQIASLQVRADVFKALGHPVRLKMVEFLAETPRCVAEIAEAVGGSFSIVSQHLAVLRQHGVILDERQGRQIYYKIAMPGVVELCTFFNDVIMREYTQQQKARRKAKTQRVLKATALASIAVAMTLLSLSASFSKRETAASAPSVSPPAMVHSAWEEESLPMPRCKDPLGTGLDCGAEMWSVLGDLLEICEREALITAR